MRKLTVIIITALLISSSFAGCGQKQESGSDHTSQTTVTDYSKSENWMELPASVDKKVDIFYVYPTVYTKSAESDPNICAVDNPAVRKNAQAVYQIQGTAFEPTGNVFAPYYQQADAKYALTLPPNEHAAFIAGTPTEDVTAAFDYFIKNYNDGRPFILAGHSQGSEIIKNILSDYMKKNPDVYKRMIAAYVIGYSITPDFLAANPHLKFAEGPDDTGVIISYNTEAPGFQGKSPFVLEGALAINPITWTRDETVAAADQNLGSIVIDDKGKVTSMNQKNYADAQVDIEKGVVVCSTAVPPTPPNVGGIYHKYDYSLYFENIKENAAKRAAVYLNDH